MAQPSLRFLDPNILSSLANMDLRARVVVEGFISGLHRSPYRGFSVEFAEYRPYMPGDDIRHVDWKVYARTDELFIKSYEEETNLSCHILLDISASMTHGSQGLSKMEYGSFLASSLAYLITRQRDGVGLALFDNALINYLPARTKPAHLHTIFMALEEAKPGRETAMGKPLHDLAEALNRKGLVILISDLLDDPETILDGLRHFRFGGHDIIVFHLLDQEELTFPFTDTTRFVDPESGQELLVVPAVVREEYLRRLNEFIDQYQRSFALANIDYCMLDTSKPLDFGLFAYLAKRSMLS